MSPSAQRGDVQSQRLGAGEAEHRDALLKVDALSVRLPGRRGGLVRVDRHARILESISLDVSKGETLGIVGESGSGKTTLGRSILRLLPRGSHVRGRVEFRGANLLELSKQAMRRERPHLQMVSQDPYGSLNPRMTVEESLLEPLKIYNSGTARERSERVDDLLHAVGLDPKRKGERPHAFSGGQLQRAAIARALMLSPDLLVCDEPVTALDVSIRAQILNLLVKLQGLFGLSYLLIAHDLDVVRHMSDRVAVIYAGSIVELGTSRSLYDRPGHPYTRVLLSSSPPPAPGMRRQGHLPRMDGEVPSLDVEQTGCPFAPRCWLYRSLGGPSACREERPMLRSHGSGETEVACHFPREAREAETAVTSNESGGAAC